MPEMSPEAINEACARKLGWQRSIRQDLWERTFDKDGKAYFQYEKELTDYCHSIEAAWEIVEKFRMNIYHRMHTPADKATFWDYAVELHIGPNQWETVSANTAPMAICLAFLKLESSHR